MKKKDIEKALRKAGYEMVGGTNHEKWKKPGCQIISVPRHKEVKERTAQRILKQIK